MNKCEDRYKTLSVFKLEKLLCINIILISIHQAVAKIIDNKDTDSLFEL